MKRLTFLLLFTLLALLLCAAAGADAPALYPFRENGLWGYMDRDGKTVIAPQYAQAEGFRGGYALVYTDGERQVCGILDASGNWALAPERREILQADGWGHPIGGWDTGIYILWETGPDRKAGFFDIPSGFCSEAAYGWVAAEWLGTLDPELLCVEKDGAEGFVSRDGGEWRVPSRYDPAQYYDFEGDFCAVRADGSAIADHWILIDAQGNEIPLPENCYLMGETGTRTGDLVPVWELDPRQNPDGFADEAERWGYIDTAGNLKIPPQYAAAWPFSGDRACVILPSGELAVITPENEVAGVIPAAFDPYARHVYTQGLLLLAESAEDGAPGVIRAYDRDAKEAFRLEIDHLAYAWEPFANGTAFYFPETEEGGGEAYAYLCGLFSLRGELLTQPVFYVREADLYGDFSEGVFPVIDAATGKQGFIDERGQWAVPPVWDRAEPFRNGLALVEKDGKLAYIDRSGAAVWEEK